MKEINVSCRGNGRDTPYSSVDVIDPPVNGYVYDINQTEPLDHPTYLVLGPWN